VGYYAAFLDVSDRRCLVVGGGAEAAGKVRGLLAAGAAVVVASNDVDDELTAMAASGDIEFHRHRFTAEDLDGCFLVIDASLDEATGVEVFAAARSRSILCNVLDRPARCDFIAPALVRRGPLQVAISTSGRSPFMASHLRKQLEVSVDEAQGQLVELVGRLRDRMRAAGVSLDVQSGVYARVPASGALELLRKGRDEEAERAVDACAQGALAPDSEPPEGRG
jgi:precorrin-2 dehydrogenase / sirohydrochlorin ferrochelatase